MDDLGDLGIVQADARQGVKIVERAVAVFTAVTLDRAGPILEAPEFLAAATTMRTVHFCSRLSAAKS